MFKRGVMVYRQADDGGGGGVIDETPASSDSAAQSVTDDVVKAQEAKVDDESVKIKSELSKAKQQLDKANKLQKELQDKLKHFEGLDANEVRALLEDKKKAEVDQLAKKGEFERLSKMMSEEHKKELTAKEEALRQYQEELTKKERIIKELTIGQAFNASQFIKDETVDYFSSTFARKIYSDYFDVEDGRVVAYDKERGASDRTPLVRGDGSPLSFDEALKKLVDSSNERDFIIRAKLKPGSDGRPADVTAKIQEPETFGVDTIVRILNAKAKKQ